MTLRDWLSQEPYTLTMSAGFFGFFAHAGAISVLAEENLIPEKITGSSAGALTGSLWAAGMNPQEMMDFFQSVDKSDFWDPGFGLGVLKGQKFRDLLATHCPIQRLEKCGIPLTVSVHDCKRWKTSVFDEGPLPELVYASCAIPPLFQPLRLNKTLYTDGAISDSSGLAGASDNARVLYHQLASRYARKNRQDRVGQHRTRLDIIEISIPDIPRINPDRLEHGVEAYTVVREAFIKRLDQPA